MQRFLRPDLLEAAGVLDFDSWAATFGQTVTQIEMAPSGGGNYRLQTRFARFQNVPEMLRSWHIAADVKTAEDLKLPTPLLWPRGDGKRLPETVLIPASPEIAGYVAELGARAEAVRAKLVTPEEDNMLKISTDGRKAALDMRMVDGEPSSTPSKLEVAAARIATIYHEHRDRTYRDPVTGEPSPTTGALQIVFCDLGTPRETWNAYDELRDQLVGHSVPRDRVRFIHEARNDAEKGRLFAAARAGDIAVLIGSTQKMGVGVNVQARCVALHHIDCPWRPADIEQRDGRALRQGNQNDEIGNYRYVVEGSFDAYSWQTVERKAGFIAQIMRGRLDVREIDDIGDSALSFAEVKALASGDPLILEKAEVDTERTRLERLQRAHQRNQHALARTIAGAEARFDEASRELPAIAGRDRGRPRHPRRRVRDDDRRSPHDQRDPRPRDSSRSGSRPTARGGIPYGRAELQLGELGELGGLPVDATLVKQFGGDAPAVELTIRGVPAQPAKLGQDLVRVDAQSLVRQLEHRIADLPALQQRTEAAGVKAADEAARAQRAHDQPFKHADALRAATTRSGEIAKLMQERQQTTPDTAAAADGTADGLSAELAELQRLRSANFPAPPAAPRRRPPARRRRRGDRNRPGATTTSRAEARSDPAPRAGRRTESRRSGLPSSSCTTCRASAGCAGPSGRRRGRGGCGPSQGAPSHRVAPQRRQRCPSRSRTSARIRGLTDAPIGSNETEDERRVSKPHAQRRDGSIASSSG